MKLSTRIFAVAFVNLALLAGVFLAFAHYQFHLNLTSFLVAPAEDRVRDVARSVASDLAQTQVANRTNLMARYAATYGVDFYLFDNDGPQLAGKPVQLPAGVRRELLLRAPADQQPPGARPPAQRPPPPARGASGRQANDGQVDFRPPPRRPPPPPRGERPPPRGFDENGGAPPDGRDPFGPPPPPDGRGRFGSGPGRGFGPPPDGRGRGEPPPEGRGRGERPPDEQGPGAPDDFGPPPDRLGRGETAGSPPPRGGASGRRPRLAGGRGGSGRSGESRGRDFSRAEGGSGGERPRRFADNAGYQTTQHYEAGLYWAMTRIPVADPANPNADSVRGSLLMVAPSFWGTPLFFDFKPWLGALAAAIGVFVLCWLPFIRGLSRSISRLTVNTGRIAEGDFENHLPENRRDEIGQLSVSINRMAGRLAGFVTGQKRFLGDIAHELSAPIARVQFALGILEQRASEDQREAVEDLHEEILHMSGLAGELLSFSKAGLDAGSAALVGTDLGATIRQAVGREGRPGIHIEVAVPSPVRAMAEPNLLMRAVSNLVRNAVRYAGPDGPITVATRREGDAAYITVADSGPVLPTEELDRVFTPFYRLDASRNRDTGGTGLGLAIVKSCVESSGGTVQCRNRQPRGLEVEIRLKATEQ